MSGYDVVVIGGGPAGMACATQARRAGLRVLLMEGFALGGELARLNTVHGLPGTPGVQGPDLVAALIDELLAEEVDIDYQEATAVRSGGAGWVINDAIETAALVLATGRHTATDAIAGATERWGRGVSSCSSCDGPLFKGKRVALAGAGEYAHTMALELADHAAEVVMIAATSPQATPAARAAVAQRPNITLLTGTRVLAVEGDGVQAVRCATESGERVEPVDGLFLAEEHRPQWGPVELGAGRSLAVGADLAVDLGGAAPAYAIGDVRTPGAHAVATALGDGVSVGWTLAARQGVRL